MARDGAEPAVYDEDGSPRAVVPATSQPGYGAACAVAALVAILAHHRAFSLGFVWLDHAHLEQRAALLPRGDWLAAFTQGFAGTGYYRPLTALSLSLDDRLGHGAAWTFHATNVALHALASASVVVAGRAFGIVPRAALLAATIFAVHPLTSEVASAIAFRSESLLVVTLALLVAAHVARRPVLAAAALVAAALTKETGLLLAPLFALALELGAPRTARVRGKQLLGAEVGAWLAVLALRASFAPAWRASQPTLLVVEHAGTRLASLAYAARDVLLPFEHRVCDAFRITPLWGTASFAGSAALVLLVPPVWRRRGPGWLLLLSLLPMLQLAPVSRWWSLHYLYVPLAFGALLAAEWLVGRWGDRRALLLGAGLATLGVVTAWSRTSRYASDAALWQPEVERDVACREGQFFLGEVARAAGDAAGARDRYRAALASMPGVLAYVDAAAAAQNLGAVELSLGDVAAARATLRGALSQPLDRRAELRIRHDLAAASLRGGDADEAWSVLAPVIDDPAVAPETLYLAAKSLHALGRDSESRKLIIRLRGSGWAPAQF